MPRKKQMTEEELIREKERIEQQIKEVRIKENVDVGIMVRQIFGKEIPNDKAGRKAFFTKLYKMYLKEKQTFVVSSTNTATNTMLDSEPTYDETMGTSDESMNED
jgi:hypothetical protein